MSPRRISNMGRNGGSQVPRFNRVSRNQVSPLSLLFRRPPAVKPESAISKLLGNITGISAVGGGGGNQGSGGLSSVTGMIANAQNAMSSVQKVTPLINQVRQYGPLIRNLPAMYKMMRVINQAEKSDYLLDSPIEEIKETSDSEVKDGMGANKLTDGQFEDEIVVLESGKITTKTNSSNEKPSLPKFFNPKLS